MKAMVMKARVERCFAMVSRRLVSVILVLHQSMVDVTCVSDHCIILRRSSIRMASA